MDNSRIAFFQPVNNFSGSCRVLLNIIEDEYKCSDYIVISTGNNGFLNSLPCSKYKDISYPAFFGKVIHGPSYVLYCMKLFIISLLYGMRYREYYINTIMPFPAVLAGRMIGCKITYHVHEKFVTPDIKEKFAAWIFKHVPSKRIYVSNYLKESYQDTKAESVIKYNRLSQSFINNIRITPCEKRKRKSILLVSARASREKGVDLFFQLAEKCKDLEFILVTEMDVDTVRKFLNNKEIENFHIFKGGASIHKYYENADILVNMSNPFFFQETFGMTILEAMAYGLPIIAPNAGGPCELVSDGINGFLVDVTDIDGICNKIYRILDKRYYETFAMSSLMVYQKIIDC